jgi:hypothetical protein
MKSWRVPTRRPLLEELEGRVVPSTLTQSYNWSGYSVTAPAGTITSVSATWTVESFARRALSGTEASWVGIDGFNSSTVEQIGTEADFSGRTATYYAWYEMYPNASVTISSFAVHAGDSITGQVSWANDSNVGGTYTLSLKNNTSGAAFSTPIASSTAFDRSSADFIVEAPSNFLGQILNLDGFGTITFSKAQYTATNSTGGSTSGPIDQSVPGVATTVNQINMINSRNQTLDSTSTINDGSNPSTFTVTRNGTFGGPNSGGGGGRGGFFAPEVVAVVSSQLPSTSFQTAVASQLPAASVNTPAAPTAAVPAAVVVSPTVSAAGLAALSGGRGSQDGAVTGPSQEQVVMPELPADGAKPADSARPDAGSDTTPMPPVPADPTSADAARASDVFFADGHWAPAAPGDGASLISDQGDDNGGTLPSIAGVLFTLSLGGAWGVARDQAAERRRRPDLR